MKKVSILSLVFLAAFVIFGASKIGQKAEDTNTTETYEETASASDFKLVGYGAGTTGGSGSGSKTVSCSTGEQIESALSDKKAAAKKGNDYPLIIKVTGAIKTGNSSSDQIDIKELDNISIIGLGTSGEFNGIGMVITRCNNIIIQNLKIHEVLASTGEGDGVSLVSCTQVWVDHCEFYSGTVNGSEAPTASASVKDKYDGLLDVKKESKNITYSWNYFHDSYKSCLSGFSDSDDYDRTVTYHHNVFRNINSRLPLFRYGKGHIYNNYYLDVWTSGINSRMGAQVYVEGNVFENVKNPICSLDSDKIGYWNLSDNSFTNCTAGSSASGSSEADWTSGQTSTCSFKPSYSYSKVSSSNVKSLLSGYVGVGVYDGTSVLGANGYKISNTTVTPTTTTTTSKAASTTTTTSKSGSNTTTTTTASGSATVSASHNVTTDGTSSSWLTFSSANTATGKGSTTYNGLSLSTCIKMESKTAIKFTTASTNTKLIVVANANKASSAIKISGAGSYTISGIGTGTPTVYEVTLASAGTYTLAKGTNQAFIYYIALAGSSTTPTTTTTTSKAATTTTTTTSKAATTTTTTTTKQSTSSLAGTYYIRNSFSGAYLSVDGTADGANIQQSYTKETFKLVDGGDGYYGILTGDSGYTKAIDVWAWATADGTNIATYSYAGGYNQVFKFQDNGDGTFAILSRLTGDASGLDLYNWDTTEGANVCLWNYWGGACQKWILESADSSTPTPTTTTTTKATTTTTKTTTQSATTTTTKTTTTTTKSSDGSTVSSADAIVAAINSASAGSKIVVKAGTYKFSSTIVIADSNNGTSSSMKTLVADGYVKFDFSSQSCDSTNRGMHLFGDYWKISGIEFYGAGDNGMLIGGNNNIVENCVFCYNRDTGLQLSRQASSLTSFNDWPANNQIINCTSYMNADPDGEDADGFAPKLTVGNGNVFDGCIAYCNSDDGWDLYTKSETGKIGNITLKNCVAFNNGYTLSGSHHSGSGDQNGFKLGGEKISVSHTITNCVAFGNGNHGFTDNSNYGTLTFTNITTYGNSQVDGNKSNLDTNRDGKGDNVYKYVLSVQDSSGSASNDKFNGTAQYCIWYNSKYYSVTSSTSVDNSGTRGSEVSGISASAVFSSTSAPSTNTSVHSTLRASNGMVNLGNFLKVKSGTIAYTYGIGATLDGTKGTANNTSTVVTGGGSTDDNNNNNNNDSGNTNTATTVEVNASNLTVQELSSDLTVSGITINATSSKKVNISSQSVTYNGVSYTKRIALNGGGSLDYRSITFTASAAGTLTVVCASSSSSATRTLVVENNSSNATTTKTVSTTSALTFTLSAGTYTIYSQSSGLNVYAVSFK